MISKFYNDVYYSNQYIAVSNGIPTRLLNDIERVFSKLVDYQLFVSPEQYEWYLHGLAINMATEQAQLRVLVANATQPLHWLMAQQKLYAQNQMIKSLGSPTFRPKTLSPLLLQSPQNVQAGFGSHIEEPASYV